MDRNKEFNNEVNKITNDVIKAHTREPKILHIEICYNLPEMGFTFAWERHTVYSGLENKFIAERNLVRCKKSEADTLIIIGERPEYLEGPEAYGVWKKGVKNIWLRKK